MGSTDLRPTAAGAVLLALAVGACGGTPAPAPAPAPAPVAGAARSASPVADCSTFDPPQTVDGTAQLWLAMEKLEAQGEEGTLRALAVAHPGTPLAQVIDRLLILRQGRAAAARSGEQVRAQMQQCAADRDRLAAEVQRLEATLEQLKQLAIDTELRAK